MRARLKAAVFIICVGVLSACRSAPIQSTQSSFFTRDQAIYDLKMMDKELRDRSPYYSLRSSEYALAFSQILESLEKWEGPVSEEQLAVLALKIVSQLGDSQARIENNALLGPHFLPFLVESIGNEYVAFKDDRSGFLAADFPYLESLDGIPIEHWFLAAAKITPAGSPHLIRRQGARNLRFLSLLRTQMGLKDTAALTVEIRSKKGQRRKLQLPVATHPQRYGLYPRQKTRALLQDHFKIAYIRIASLGERRFEAQWNGILGLEDSHAFILDLRGNGRGSPKLLSHLLPHFLAPDSGPRIASIASFRLHRSMSEGDLADHGLYPVTSSRIPEETKKYLASEFRFKPEIPLKEGDFSEPHYSILHPQEPPRHSFHTRPVVLLMDEGCAADAEVFLSAFQGLENAHLVGTPSSGSAGRPRSFALPNSRLRIRLSTMAAFQRNGKLFERRGLSPDLIVTPTPEYFVGGRDRMLEKAIATAVHDLRTGSHHGLD